MPALANNLTQIHAQAPPFPGYFYRSMHSVAFQDEIQASLPCLPRLPSLAPLVHPATPVQPQPTGRRLRRGGNTLSTREAVSRALGSSETVGHLRPSERPLPPCSSESEALIASEDHMPATNDTRTIDRYEDSSEGLLPHVAWTLDSAIYADRR